MQRIYLDNNATTPLDPQVLESILQYHRKSFGNPSSVHSFGQEAKQILTHARRNVASFFSVKPEQVVFHSGATEGLNTLLSGVTKGHIITSNVEHAAVYYPLKQLEKRGVALTYLSAGLKGYVDSQQVQEAIRSDTQMIVTMGVNNETGVIFPVQEIAKIAKQAGIPYIVDGVAMLGKEDIRLYEGVSALVFSAHKIHGPKGVGFTLLQKGFKYSPLIVGGEQEFEKRAGTENLSGIVGLAKAVELLKIEDLEYMANLRNHFERQIMEKVPGIRINGQGNRTVNVSNLLFEGRDGESLLMNFDLQGLAVSHGSACSSGALEPSRVLLSMGLTTKEAAGSLRFSFSRMNSIEEVDQAVAIILSLWSQ